MNLLSFGAILFAGTALAVTLDDFQAVYKAKMTREGPNQVRLILPSAEWDSGLRWEPKPAADFSQAKFLAVDVENVSRTRQARLTLHVSAGGAEGDSGDHASALSRKTRSVNTGIGLNPGEKGTMKLLLVHPGVYGYPSHARGPSVLDTAHITKIELKMQWPYEDEIAELADVRISNLRLEGVPEQDRFVAPQNYAPFVDPYGQFVHAEWPQKVHRDDDLRADLAREMRTLLPPPSSWDRFGGWAEGPQLEATGHFRTANVEGKWWLVTPEGHLFFSTGVDVARIMTDITDASAHPEWFQGEIPADGKVPFTKWNLETKFGTAEYAQEYYDFMLRRFDSWGLNTIGNWAARELLMTGKKPYVACVLERAKGVKRHPSIPMYDLQDPHFEERFRQAIQERFREDESLRRAATDPMCIGFFVDNELPFPKWISSVGAEKARPFLELYFRICKEELQRVAPGKLYLGSRFVGFRQSGLLWSVAATYCDVITVNAYANSVYNLSEKMFRDGIEKPILVGEFHFGCLDRGMFAPGLAPVWSQEERGRSYERFVEGCLRHPLIVGCHWFQYRDQPLLGRGDGEAYQIGFVDVCDRPYPELCNAARQIGASLYKIRSAPTWK